LKKLLVLCLVALVFTLTGIGMSVSSASFVTGTELVVLDHCKCLHVVMNAKDFFLKSNAPPRPLQEERQQRHYINASKAAFALSKSDLPVPSTITYYLGDTIVAATVVNDHRCWMRGGHPIRAVPVARVTPWNS